MSTRRLTYNEFQRELLAREIDPKMAYFFSMLYEQQSELIKQQEETGKLLIAFANQLEGFIELHARTQQGLQNLERYGKTAGVDVASTTNFDPKKQN